MFKTKDENIIGVIKNISTIAAKEKWVLTLDREEEALFYTSKNIPNNAELFQITDEYALYMDKEQKPYGLMIEYFGHNFIKHHPEFKKLSEDVFGKDEKETTVAHPKTDKKDDILVLKALLEKTLIAETV